jgi:UrcA family protein
MNPRLTFSFVSPTLLLLAGTGLVIDADPAIAQETAEEMEEITVEAPMVRHEVGKSTSVAKTRLIELKQRVSYADLDLSKQADVTELETRIKAIAKESCSKLEEMYPTLLTVSRIADIRRCTNQAVARTEDQVQAAIAAAS